MPNRTIYRDTKTGRFAKKSTWQRSQSGRYKRQILKPKQAPPPPLSRMVFEWIVSFTYSKSGRSFDVIATAYTSEQAKQVAKDFLAHNPNGKKIARADFVGWEIRVARGNETDEEAGEAEYRSESRA